jgi:hypothetical protein
VSLYAFAALTLTYTQYCTVHDVSFTQSTAIPGSPNSCVNDTELNQSVCSSITSPKARRSSNEQHVYGAPDDPVNDDVNSNNAMDTDDANDSDDTNKTVAVVTVSKGKGKGKGKAKVKNTILCIVHYTEMPLLLPNHMLITSCNVYMLVFVMH